MVFDDLFTTVASVERENNPPSHWNDLCLDQTEFIPIDTPVSLSHEWLSETDTAQEDRTDVHANRFRQDIQGKASASEQLERLFLPSSSQPAAISQTEGELPHTSGSLNNPVAESEGAVSPAEPSVTDPSDTVHTYPPHESGLRHSARRN